MLNPMLKVYYLIKTILCEICVKSMKFDFHFKASDFLYPTVDFLFNLSNYA